MSTSVHITRVYQREYRSYQSMVQRCTNPKRNSYRIYGARGISIYPGWLGRGGFARFLEHVGQRPDGMTLDRIDRNGNYEPGNVRWATPAAQSRNTCRTKLITIGDVTQCERDWCSAAGVPVGTFRTRVRSGMSAERALFGGKAERPNLFYIECRGERRTLKEWSDLLGVKRTTIRRRLELGWPAERAVGAVP